MPIFDAIPAKEGNTVTLDRSPDRGVSLVFNPGLLGMRGQAYVLNSVPIKNETELENAMEKLIKDLEEAKKAALKLLGPKAV